ncbi:hypothetical protein ACFLWC_04200 [Chloroflexota bacterium]
MKNQLQGFGPNCQNLEAGMWFELGDGGKFPKPSEIIYYNYPGGTSLNRGAASSRITGRNAAREELDS